MHRYWEIANTEGRKRAVQKLFLREFSLALLLFSVVLCFPLAASAKTRVNVSVEPKSGTVEDVFILEVTLSGSGAQALGSPQFESSSEFTLESAGTTMGHSFINGLSRSKTTFSYRVYPSAQLRPGTYRLPKGYFVVEGNKVALKQPQIEITDRKKVGSQIQAYTDFTQFVDNDKPFVGQQILYKARFVSRARAVQTSLDDADFQGFWRESYGSMRETAQVSLDNRTHLYSVREALFPAQAGELTIPARVLSTRIEVPSRHFRGRGWDPFREHWPGLLDFNPLYDTVTKRFVADPITVDAQPLPPSPVKDSGYIPVGRVRLASSVDKILIKKGESVNMTVELYGDANLRPYELPESFGGTSESDFKIYRDKPQIQTFYEDNHIAFKKKFTLALVPQRTGKLELPLIRIVTFDPEKMSYQILETPKRSLVVDPSEAEEQLIVSTGKDASTSIDTARKKRRIQVLGTDLLPQEVGKRVYGQRKVVAATTWIAIILFAPLFSIALSLYGRRWTRLRADPKLSASMNAWQSARDELEAVDRLADDEKLGKLTTILKTYLGNKFMRTGDSLTPNEAAELLRAQLGDSTLVEKVRATFAKLEGARFGGDASPLGEKDFLRLADEVKSNIREIERTSRK